MSGLRTSYLHTISKVNKVDATNVRLEKQIFILEEDLKVKEVNIMLLKADVDTAKTLYYEELKFNIKLTEELRSTVAELKHWYRLKNNSITSIFWVCIYRMRGMLRV